VGDVRMEIISNISKIVTASIINLEDEGNMFLQISIQPEVYMMQQPSTSARDI
jgi:hypothetical protein